MTLTSAISLSSVSVEFNGRTALADVSLTLGPTGSVSDRRVGVIGSNGSGKSTFARLLNGLVTPTAGSLTVLGFDPVREAKTLRRDVGFIFSNPDAQIVMPTVQEDVAFSLRGRGLSGDEISARVAVMLETYGLAAHSDAPAHTLSGGQKQLLALCAILVTEPRLLVADEPTALLDAANTRRIGALLLDELPQQLVLVTHDLKLAARCDVVLRFEAGKLVEHGEPAEVIRHYEALHA